jgi:alpha-galactosidase
LVFEGGMPEIVGGAQEEAVILNSEAPLAPQIHGPAVYGARPGNAFLYRIPTTGERPIRFSVDHLPASLRLDQEEGILSGTTPEAGTHVMTLRAENRHGAVSRELRLQAGSDLALTPPMGWNDWYAHYDRITDAMMRRAADIMVEKGMADVGYTYVSIDDCWMNAPENKDPLRVGPLRDERGDILSNRHFPDMHGLTEHIHGYGLKAGIYTSPGPLTCAGFSGSFEHEEADAARFADWGFDLLKYDWCSYGGVSGVDGSLESMKKPYVLMGDLLQKQRRDIVLILCQYGMGDVWKWGAEVVGHWWRTSGDLGFELGRIFQVALANAGHREFNRPGAWNDPDYIQIGHIGSAFGMGEPRPCPLSPGEQYAFMSLWSLMACPLFYSGDLESLDAFTLNVLCNPEVIAINQDELGECARPVMVDAEVFWMVKRMVDGSVALGVFNSGDFDAEVAVGFADLGIAGARRVRDVWRQQDVILGARSYAGKVGRRSGVLLRLSGTTVR